MSKGYNKAVSGDLLTKLNIFADVIYFHSLTKVDWWGIGVLVYEFVAGYPPFFADQPMITYNKIVSGKVRYPSHFR